MIEFSARYVQMFRRLFPRLPSARARRPRRPAASPAEIELLEPRRLLTVTYHGGGVLANVETQAVYLGSDWQSTATLHTQTGQFDQFLTTLVSGQYMDMLTNAGYGVGRGTSTAGAIDNISLNKTSGITDTAIQQDIQAMITAGTLQAPDANRLYIVYVEPGVVVHNGTDSSATTFLGYHDAFGGHTKTGGAADIHYAVIPYPDGVNISHVSQGFATAFDEQTAVTSHEVAEAVTDPNVNYKNLGWYDDQRNGEIGDLTRLTVVFNGYLVQEVVDKNDHAISPTTSVTNTLTAPQNVTVKASSSTVAVVSWSSSTGATGYRIFQVNGTQSVLLGTVSSSTNSFQITGLTAGATVSFKVEAYNGTTVADSQVVTVKMTSVVNLTPPVLSGRILSLTKLQLNWTTVPGTTGYNIYYSDGVFRYYLGTVGSGTTSVLVTGLAPGATYQFQVEAYHGSAVSDSNWLSVNTGTHQVHSSVAGSAVEPTGRMGWSEANRRASRG
jgi:hypothetical protein